MKFWKLKIPHKLQIFLWKLIHNTLPVKHNLRHYATTNDVTCMLCNSNQIEDINHLFFTCHFAKTIWNACLPQHYNHLQQYLTLHDWFDSWSSPTSVINFSSDIPSIHGITTTLWHIWKFRCQVMFQHSAINPNSVLCPLFKYLTDVAYSSLYSSYCAY